MTGFYNMIRRQDFFGHKITLQFNKRGNKHKTCIGGLCSILFIAFIIFHFIQLIVWMSEIEEDVYSESYNQYTSYVGFNDSASFKESRMELMAGLYHQGKPVSYVNNRTL